MVEYVGGSDLWFDNDTVQSPTNGRLDRAQPANGAMGTATFGATTATRWLQLKHTGDSSGSGVTPGAMNDGFRILIADMDATEAGAGVLPANRVIQAQTVFIEGEINSTAVGGGNGVIRCFLSKHNTDGSYTVLTQTDTSNISLAVAGIKSWAQSFGFPRTVFAPGETLHLTVFIQAQGVAITGQTITLRRGAGTAAVTPRNGVMSMGDTGLRYEYPRSYTGGATPAGALKRVPSKPLTAGIVPRNVLSAAAHSFEDGTLGGWTTDITGTGGSIVNSTAQADVGTRSVLMTKATSGQTRMTLNVPVVPGTRYALRTRLWTGTDATLRVEMAFFTSGDVQLGGSSSLTGSGSPSAWSNFSPSSAVAPETAAYAKLIVGHDLAGTGGTIAYFDRISFGPYSRPLFRVNKSLDGGFSIAQLTGALAKRANKAVAGTILPRRAGVEALSAESSGFEGGTLGSWGLAGATEATLTNSTTQAHTGARSALISKTAAGGPFFGVGLTRSFNVNAATYVTMSGWARSVSGTVSSRMVLGVNNSSFGVGTTWTFQTLSAVIPAGPFDIEFLIQSSEASGVGVYWDDLSVTVSRVRLTPLKALAGALTPVGALFRRQPLKPLAGALTPTGALIRRALRFLSGSNTPAGTVRRTPRKSPVGTITPGPSAMVWRVNKALSGTVTPSPGAITRRVTKFFAGGVTPSGAVLKTLVRYFTGALSSVTGVLRKVPNKPFAAAITPSPGVLVRRPNKALAGTITPGPSALRWMINKALSGLLTPVGAVTKRVSTFRAGSVTSSGAIRKVPNKPFVATITPGPSAMGRAIVKTFTGVVATAGAVTRRPMKSLGGSIASSAALLKTYSKNVMGFLYGVGHAPDWPITTPTKQIAGVVIDHEAGTPLTGTVATIKLYRDVDDIMVQTTTSSAADGSFSFVRDAADPYTYHYTADYTISTVQWHGISDRGLVPTDI